MTAPPPGTESPGPPRRPTRASRAAWWARTQPALLALLAFGGGAVTVGLLADAVAGGPTQSVDFAVLAALRENDSRRDGLGPAWVAEAAAEFTVLGGKAVIPAVVLLAAGYLALTRRPGLAVGLTLSVAGAAAVTFLLKDVIDRPRPPPSVRLRDDHTTASFPSTHAAIATVTYLTLGVLAAEATNRRAVRVYCVSAGVLIAAGVGLTRSTSACRADVAAGWLIGGCWAYALRAITARLRARRYRE